MSQVQHCPSVSSDLLAAFKETIPVLMGYVPLGMAFGFLFTQAGGDWWWAVMSSVVVFAGAAQFMMIPMLVSGLSYTAIALATLIINFRHIFYGISLLHRYPQKGLARWYLIFALTDETYSLVTAQDSHTSERKLLFISGLNQLWWVSGTLIGSVIGAQAELAVGGIDFVLTALFGVLSCEQWRARKTAWPLSAALLGYAVARLVSPDNVLALSIFFCVLVGLAWGVLNRRTKESTLEG